MNEAKTIREHAEQFAAAHNGIGPTGRVAKVTTGMDNIMGILRYRFICNDGTTWDMTFDVSGEKVQAPSFETFSAATDRAAQIVASYNLVLDLIGSAAGKPFAADLTTIEGARNILKARSSSLVIDYDTVDDSGKAYCWLVLTEW